ncbi:MAG: translation initiation factor IF-2 subunit alpha [Sulfolobales archaeon]|nr:translation initiation factor IF-2 subunit alpha [Sulfolobales archaeon]MDW8083486.1 translation initiation factor IF-2 subunit alpha [Sulfolobales archaeon]
MVKKKEALPSINELCVATVDKVFDLGVYVKLDEYENLEAYLPWNEVSSKWVKNIREVVKEGQKVVVKVIRVDRKKNQVDVSLKRVAEVERKRKLKEWKRAKRAEKILEIVSKKLGRSMDEAYSEVWWKLEKAYGDVLAAFEDASTLGDSVLRDAELSDTWISELMKEIPKHIKPKQVRIDGRLTLTTYESDGIYRIKEVLESLVEDLEEVKLRVYSEGAPRYRIELVGTDYKILEAKLAEVVERAETLSKKLNVSFSFERVKLG